MDYKYRCPGNGLLYGKDGMEVKNGALSPVEKTLNFFLKL
jgi:hypothetical protein